MITPESQGPPLWLVRLGQRKCGEVNRVREDEQIQCDLPEGHPIDITVQLRPTWVVHRIDHASREHQTAWTEPHTVKRPSEWAALKGIRVVSPDGWHAGTVAWFPGRKGVKKRISEREFDARAAVSTIETIKTEEAPVPEAGTTARVCGVQNPWQPTTTCTLAAGHPVPTEVVLYGPGTAPVTCDHAEPEHTATAWLMGDQAGTRVGNLLGGKQPAAEQAAADGEAYVELRNLLDQLVLGEGRNHAQHSEIEAVIALAGLVRNERGLTDVDPQDDPGPEELRVQGAQRFAVWADERNLFQPMGSDPRAGLPPTALGLVTRWLHGERMAATREDDRRYPETSTETPVDTDQPMALRIKELERLLTVERDALGRVQAERDDLREQHATWVGQREDYRGKMAELRTKNQRQAAMLDEQIAVIGRITTERDQAQTSNVELARTAIEQNTKIIEAHRQRRELESALMELRPAGIKPVQPADAVWDFLDWMRIKGWSVSTSWPIGPEAHHATTAEWGSSVLDGLVQGWHWARHGQWEHARLNQPMEAPADDLHQMVETQEPTPGSFAYEHQGSDEETDRG